MAFCLSPAKAQESTRPAEDPLPLETVVVVASRIPRPLSDVAAQVTVIDAADIERLMIEDPDALTAYLPGVDVEVSGSRFGDTGINLRGVGGNRVAIERDGIPVPDRFAIGAFSDSGRSLADTDRIKRIEVLNGPASVLYGSDAIGGIVAIQTWDPSDLLARTDDSTYLQVRGGYRSANASWVGSGMAAWGDGPHALLLAATYRNGHELDNQRPSGWPNDPQDWDSTDVMLRYTFDTAAGNRLRLTAAGEEQDASTLMFSQLGYGRRFGTTTRLNGMDHNEGDLLSLDYQFSWGRWEQGILRLFHSSYQVEQLTLEERRAANPPIAMRRYFEYEQDYDGFDFTLFRRFAWGEASHRLGLGVELLQTESRELRDGLQTSLENGMASNVILGEEFPTRDFPFSRSRELGLFAQDEIDFGDGRWELIPALRWDRYELDPRPDALWLQHFPDTGVVAVEDEEFTPRLGLLFHAGPDWTIYGQYAHGFRAPPFEDANIGLDVALFGYRAIPNPDLLAETSDGYEIGVRRIVGGNSFSLAAFHTDYDDFIETRALIGVDPMDGYLVFQSRNIDRARVRGLDLRYEQALGRWHEALTGWRMTAAAYWAEGENLTSGKPLNSIAPPQAVIGLTWGSRDGVWDLAFTSVLTAGKRESDIDTTGGQRLAVPGWGTLDVTAGWQVGEGLTMRAGVFNLGDKSYWRWLDVANLAADDPMIPVLSMPGRNYALSMVVSF
jgi:hemoglobin/transferrin/lactoferrin receptor protein